MVICRAAGAGPTRRTLMTRSINFSLANCRSMRSFSTSNGTRPIPTTKVKPEGLKDFSDFGWNAKLFPNPQQQIKLLHDAGVHFVGIRKPRLGNSDTLAMVRQKGWGFQSNNNVNGRGLLFANPDARSWYAQQIEPLLGNGVDGWWNDEGEFTYTNYLYWNMAQRQALDAVHPESRLWTLNRAFQPGLSPRAPRPGPATSARIRARSGSKHGPAELEHRRHAAERLPDMGGFSGQATPELLTRWMQAGTFFPIMRFIQHRIQTPLPLALRRPGRGRDPQNARTPLPFGPGSV